MPWTNSEGTELNTSCDGKSITVDLEYPRLRENDGRPDSVIIDLSDVRAAEPIRVSFDFHRNGWIIESPGKYDETKDENPENWHEVSFVEIVYTEYFSG